MKEGKVEENYSSAIYNLYKYSEIGLVYQIYGSYTARASLVGVWYNGVIHVYTVCNTWEAGFATCISVYPSSLERQGGKYIQRI